MSDNTNAPTNGDWEPVASSVISALAISIPGLVILFYGTIKPRKAHMMNVFS